MKKLRFLSLIAVAMICIPLLNSCTGGGSDTDGTAKTDTLSSTDTAKLAPKAPVISDTSVQPEKCTIVFDASLSMKGYVDATVNGSFPGVIAELNNMGKQTDSYLFDVKKTPIDNFLSKIQNKNIPWTNDSDLFGMFKDIMTSAANDPGNCYVLVTDGIISGSSAEIKADPTYNISKPEILQGRIDSIINHLPQDKPVALLVAKYMAPFNGTYFCYDNTKKALKNEMRPFYVLAAGGADQINYVADQLSKRPGVETALYGALYPMSVSTNAKMIGGSKYKYDKSVKDKGEGLNLEIKIAELPAYAKNINYLRKNLEIIRTNSNGKKFPLKPSTGNAEEDDYVVGDYDIEISGDKAIISLSDKVINTLPSDFTCRLKRIQPQWVEDASTSDDINNYRPDATLNLTYFMKPFLRINNAEYIADAQKTISIKK